MIIDVRLPNIVQGIRIDRDGGKMDTVKPHVNGKNSDIPIRRAQSKCVPACVSTCMSASLYPLVLFSLLLSYILAMMYG